MSQFWVYLQVGIEHIIDANAYDHIVFIVALHAVYKIRQWPNILILVTAFTIGHSVTLALAALNVILIPSYVIEFLIPVTILLTCIYNILESEESAGKKKFHWNYPMALFFGLIHGLGFSNYFRALLGAEEDIVMPLFSFNIGVEIGQIAIIIVILAAQFIFVDLLKAKHREWNLFVSGMAGGVAVILMKQTAFFLN